MLSDANLAGRSQRCCQKAEINCNVLGGVLKLCQMQIWRIRSQRCCQKAGINWNVLGGVLKLWQMQIWRIRSQRCCQKAGIKWNARECCNLAGPSSSACSLGLAVGNPVSLHPGIC